MHRVDILLCAAVILSLTLAACGSAPAPTSIATTAPDTAVTEAASPVIPAFETASSAPAVVDANNAPPPTDLPATAEPTPGLPVDENGVELVARVNGVGISKPAFERELARTLMQQVQAADPVALQGSVLDTMIEQKVIEQAAAAQNIVVTDAEVQAEIDLLLQALGGDQAAWQKWLLDNLYSEDEFRQVQRQSILTQRMRDVVTQSLNGDVLQVHARHILVATRAEAEDIMNRLRSGEDFGTLAMQWSRDITTREQGGDLGWFTINELLIPALAQVAFTIEPGQVAGPVETMLGFHVVQSLERAERPVPEEKRAMLAQTEFELWLAAQVQSATIERYLNLTQ